MDIRSTLAGAIAEDMVAEIAPEEEEFFHDIVQPPGDAKTTADSYLGFGGEDTVMVLATTALISIAKTVAAFLWENGKDATGQLVKDCSKSLQEALAKWFAKKVKGDERSPIQLSKETITELLSHVLASPDAAKLSLEQRTNLVNWIEGRLSSQG